MEQVFTPEIVSRETKEARSYHRAELKSERKQAQLEVLRDLAANPVIELIVGIAAITYLNKGSSSWLESITGIDLKAGGEYAGLIAIIGLQQISSHPETAAVGAAALKTLPALLAL